MTIIILILLIVLGASIGSFLSVIIHRVEKQQKGIIIGRSRCPHCRKTLAAADLVPILNYLYLHGKCRYCRKSISPMYFFLEIACVLVFVLLYLKFTFVGEYGPGTYSINTATLLQYAFYALNSVFLIGIFFHDLQYTKIPDIFIWPFIAISLIGSLVMKNVDFPNLMIAVALAALFFGGQRVLSKGQWLGEGDVYVGVGMALLFGWRLLIVAIALTYLSGCAISIILLMLKKVDRRSKIPFAPFMVFGSLATLLYGQQILAWYSNIYF